MGVEDANVQREPLIREAGGAAPAAPVGLTSPTVGASNAALSRAMQQVAPGTGRGVGNLSAGALSALLRETAAPDAPAAAGSALPQLDRLIAGVGKILAFAEESLGEAAGQDAHVAGTRALLAQLEAVRAQGDEAMAARVLPAFTLANLTAAEPSAGVPAGAEVPGAGAPASQPTVARQISRSRRTVSRQIGEALVAAGTGLLVADAEAAPLEAAAGPPGWAIAGTVAIVGAGLLGIGILMSSGGRPKRNTDQNKQFNDAVKEIERQIGRRLTKDELRRLHEALHGEENPGFWEIVQLGLDLFGGSSGESGGNDGAEGAGPGEDHVGAWDSEE
jgi:hypothetical protein